MSGLFRRLSGRRSAGPEGDEPQTAAEPGAADASAHTPAEERGHQSLLTDPATGYVPAGDAPTNVMGGDPRAQRSTPGDDPDSAARVESGRDAATSGDPLASSPSAADSG